MHWSRWCAALSTPVVSYHDSIDCQQYAAVTVDSPTRPFSCVGPHVCLYLQMKLLAVVTEHRTSICDCVVTNDLAVAQSDISPNIRIQGSTKQGLVVAESAVCNQQPFAVGVDYSKSPALACGGVVVKGAVPDVGCKAGVQV